MFCEAFTSSLFGYSLRWISGLALFWVLFVEVIFDQCVLLELFDKGFAFLAHSLGLKHRFDLVLDILERCRTGGAAVLDLDDVKAVGPFDQRADLADRQGIEPSLMPLKA